MSDKQAKEFSTKEELRNYLKDHPNADPKNHKVRDIQGPGHGVLKVKKIPKEMAKGIKRLWLDNGGEGSSSDAVGMVMNQISKGKPVSHRSIQNAMKLIDSALYATDDKNLRKDYKELKKTLKGLAKSDLKRQAREAAADFQASTRIAEVDADTRQLTMLSAELQRGVNTLKYVGKVKNSRDLLRLARELKQITEKLDGQVMLLEGWH